MLGRFSHICIAPAASAAKNSKAVARAALEAMETLHRLFDTKTIKVHILGNGGGGGGGEVACRGEGRGRSSARRDDVG